MLNALFLDLITSLAQSVERLAFTVQVEPSGPGFKSLAGCFFFPAWYLLYGTAFQPLVTAHLYTLAMKEAQNQI